MSLQTSSFLYNQDPYRHLPTLQNIQLSPLPATTPLIPCSSTNWETLTQAVDASCLITFYFPVPNGQQRLLRLKSARQEASLFPCSLRYFLILVNSSRSWRLANSSSSYIPSQTATISPCTGKWRWIYLSTQQDFQTLTLLYTAYFNKHKARPHWQHCPSSSWVLKII